MILKNQKGFLITTNHTVTSVNLSFYPVKVKTNFMQIESNGRLCK